MKGFDDIREMKSAPVNWSHMVKVIVKENRMGNLFIIFKDGKSIFAQAESEIEAFVDALVYIEETDSYYISDEHIPIATKI